MSSWGGGDILRTGSLEALALEYMAQMSPTRAAHDLGANHPAREVVLPLDRPRDRCTQCVRSAPAFHIAKKGRAD